MELKMKSSSSRVLLWCCMGEGPDVPSQVLGIPWLVVVMLPKAADPSARIFIYLFMIINDLHESIH
jgi:hypothetical protein